MQLTKIIGTVCLATTALAQNITSCVSGGVCYAVNIPSTTASSGSGDIFIQISGPSSLSWIGLGQGSSMTGSNMFIIYSNAVGDNVTLSPRLGVGTRPPSLDSAAQVTLLAGSGISGGIMTANFRCANCGSWSGGSMSFTDSSSEWIWAYLSGQEISSDSVTSSISRHSRYGGMSLNLQNAAGGSTSNPFLGVAAAAPSSGSDSGAGSYFSESSGSGAPSSFTKILMAHGILGGIAFVVLFPLGGTIVRVLSFQGHVWLHAGWMLITYAIALAALGLGVWLAVTADYLDSTHAIIGLVVVGGLFLQPFTGLLHHRLYKSNGHPTVVTYGHRWWGRAVITLGIINGGLGLKLAANTRNGEIAYGIVAGIIWVFWMSCNLLTFIRQRRRDANGGLLFRGDAGDSREKMRPPQPL